MGRLPLTLVAWLLASVVVRSGTDLALAEPPEPPDPPPLLPPKYDKGPFDIEADIGKQIADALRNARRDNKRVLLHYGGNYSPKCIEMHKLLTEDPQLSRLIQSEYEYVLADYGQPPGKNMNLPKQYGAEPMRDGVPYFTVLDSAGRMFANQGAAIFEKPGGGVGGSGGYDTAAIAKFLVANKVALPPAQSVLDKGLNAAKTEEKSVFLRFGAPWCVWCRRMDAWVSQPEIAAILAKDFVLVKVDTERNAGGGAMLRRMAGEKPTGIPWFAFLDAQGKPIAESFDSAGENIGFPAAPGEIASFGEMLAAAARRSTPEEREKLLASLREEAGKSEPATSGEERR